MAITQTFTEGAIEVGPPATPGETRARRIALSRDRLVTQPWPGIDTVHDVLAYAARAHGTKNALGWRDVVRTHEEEKVIKKVVGGEEVSETKKWKYFELSDYKYFSFVDVQEAAHEISRGLVNLGIEKHDVLNIFASTSANWMLVFFACMSISITAATAYDNLGESGLQHSLNEPSCAAIFTNADLLPVVSKIIANVPSLRLVIYTGDAAPALLDKMRTTRPDTQVMSLDEVRRLGQSTPLESVAGRLPKSEDVALIQYTSGSMGPPKGVEITHSNLVATVGAVYFHLGKQFHPSDVFIAYLPLAHILELGVELALYFLGLTFGYGSVKTLTDASVRGCYGDIRTLRPTVMIGVPAVFELIRKGILAQVHAGSKLKQAAFYGAYSAKRAGIPLLGSLADKLVLKQVRAAVGGRLRFALSGGAALSKNTQEFLSVAIAPIIQGYGMTETCALIVVLPPEMLQYGVAGIPVPSIEIKLMDVPDLGYFSTNHPPQGEVCVRGPGVIKSYYKRDDLNNDESIFTKDGWFRTGDVGQWNPNGTMSIIDRVKNLVKLQGGEYIALERLESIYKSCNLVANLCVHGDENASQPIAVVIPHEAHLRQALASGAIPDFDATVSFPELCQDRRVTKLVLNELNATGSQNGFRKIEMLEAVILTSEEWTPQNGLVTAAQKIQRKKVAEAFAAEIKDIYRTQ